MTEDPTRSPHDEPEPLQARVAILEAKLRACEGEVQELWRVSRGSMASIRSLLRRMMRGDPDGGEFAALFAGRLDAIGRAQALQLQGTDGGTDLESLILDELRAAAPHVRIMVSGPAVRVARRAVEPLCLAFHELATNAVRFGDLGSDRGALSIAWTTEDGTLVAVWTETWAEPIQHRHRSGMGIDTIENRLPYELGERSEVAISAEGVLCRIRLPRELWSFTPRSSAGGGAGR